MIAVQFSPRPDPLAAALAQIARATAGRRQPPSPYAATAKYEPPAPVCRPTINEHRAAANAAGLSRFVDSAVMGAGLKDTPADAVAYLAAAIARLNGYIAALDGCGPTPAHLQGIQGSDIALAIGALEVRKAKFEARAERDRLLDEAAEDERRAKAHDAEAQYRADCASINRDLHQHAMAAEYAGEAQFQREFAAECRLAATVKRAEAATLQAERVA